MAAERLYTGGMPIDVSPGSFAAVVITALFWWTVLSPVALLAVAALCGRRPRLRAVLTIAVLVPPVVTLLPVAAMHGGLEAVAAAGAVAIDVAAVILALASLARANSDPGASGAARDGRVRRRGRRRHDRLARTRRRAALRLTYRTFAGHRRLLRVPARPATS